MKLKQSRSSFETKALELAILTCTGRGWLSRQWAGVNPQGLRWFLSKPIAACVPFKDFESMIHMRPGIASKIGLLGVSTLQGGYMLFDGVHKLHTGSYFGNRLGPWANFVSILGIDPNAIAPVFIALGALWLVGGVALLLKLRWSRLLLTALSVISLAYLVFGTVLSVVSLVLLRARRDSSYGDQRARSQFSN
jgi:hypothetical protein